VAARVPPTWFTPEKVCWFGGCGKVYGLAWVGRSKWGEGGEGWVFGEGSGRIWACGAARRGAYNGGCGQSALKCWSLPNPPVPNGGFVRHGLFTET